MQRAAQPPVNQAPSRRTVAEVLGGIVLLGMLLYLVLFHIPLKSELNAAREQEWNNFYHQPYVESTFAAGLEIVAAIERYQADHGRYPQTLDLLEPDYLSTVPLPCAGRREWRYSATRSGFSLRFGIGPHCYPLYYYSYSDGEWQYDG